MLLYCHRMLAVPGSRVLKEAALFRGASIEQAFPGRSQKGQFIPGAYRSRESRLVCARAQGHRNAARRHVLHRVEIAVQSRRIRAEVE